MGEDVLQAHQPHQDLLVGLLRKRVTDHVELYNASPLLQTRCLIPRRIGRQETCLREQEVINPLMIIILSLLFYTGVVLPNALRGPHFPFYLKQY